MFKFPFYNNKIQAGLFYFKLNMVVNKISCPKLSCYKRKGVFVNVAIRNLNLVEISVKRKYEYKGFVLSVLVYLIIIIQVLGIK